MAPGGLTTADSWVGVLAYSLQIYFDFSAYSDMAIGISHMFGFKLPINFNSPYQATSIIEFWRRWHITLSAFLRDYVYISLGGNRHGPSRRYVNLLLTMLIGGLWHGAGWTFVAWGALHGSYLVINHVWATLSGRKRVLPSPLGAVAGWALTFIGVTVAWVFFRAPDFHVAARVLEAMAGTEFAPRLGPQFGAYHVALVSAGVAAVAVLPSLQQLFRRHRVALGSPTRPFLRLAWRPTFAWGLVSAIVFMIAVFSMDAPKAFIYFQF
jgi:D-alanyl-lipoteichoic acid acyltransferase DltB (MBOAT superfamily)